MAKIKEYNFDNTCQTLASFYNVNIVIHELKNDLDTIVEIYSPGFNPSIKKPGKFDVAYPRIGKLNYILPFTQKMYNFRNNFIDIFYLQFFIPYYKRITRNNQKYSRPLEMKYIYKLHIRSEYKQVEAVAFFHEPLFWGVCKAILPLV